MALSKSLPLNGGKNYLAEKHGLKVRIGELTKVLSELPQWKDMRDLETACKKAEESCRIAGEKGDEHWLMDAQDWRDLVFDEKEEYRKTKFLPALKAHPLGPEYIEAFKRLKQLKWH